MNNTILLDMAPSPSIVGTLGIPLLIIMVVVIIFFTALNLIDKVQKKNKDLITVQKEAERKAEHDAKIETIKRTEINEGK